MSNRRSKVAVVGGGLAGLSAAISLTRQNVDCNVTVFEAKRVTGGRAGSFLDAASGDEVDYCQHVAMGCCTNLLKTLQLAGQLDQWTRYRSLSFHHLDFLAASFDNASWLPPPFHLLPTLVRLPYLSWTQRYRIARATWALMRSRPTQLAGIVAADWLTNQRQSAATIRDYWDIVIASALGESTQRVSIASVRKVFVDGFLASRDASDVWAPKQSLAKLFGVMLPAFVQSCGAQVRTGAKVTRVALSSDEKITVVLDNEAIDFDHVILATPIRSLAKIVETTTAAAAGLAVASFAQVPMSPITGIHLWFDRPVMDQPHVVLVGTLAQWVFNSKQQDAPEIVAEHYVQVVVSASHVLRNAESSEIIDQVVAELKRAFPKTSAAKLLRSKIVTDPRAVFSLTPEVDELRPISKTKLSNLHLAGDFVQTTWPATMEGAVISGMMAASSVLEQLGQPVISIDPGLPATGLCRWLIRNN